MTWQLTARTGLRRGVSWVIGDQPLILGRSLACDVIVSDPTVSRRHCELYCEDGRVKFRDLGSRNVALINGREVRECILDMGDELSLGTDAFILSRAASTANGNAWRTPPPERDTTTMSLGAKRAQEPWESGWFDADHPATAPEMVRLFQLSQQLHRASSLCEFATRCLLAVRDLVSEQADAFVCFRLGGGELDVYPRDNTPPARALKQVARAMQRGESLVKLDRKCGIRVAGQICIVPLCTNGGSHAALLLTSQARRFFLEDRDVRRLESVAGVAALHLPAVRERRYFADSYRDLEDGLQDVFGKSAAATALRADIGAAAKTRLNVLITGEAGTGKFCAARMIHRQSPPPRGTFIEANCEDIAGAAFARTLVGEEREDVGGGRIVEAGLLDQANGGTLVLQEIGALTPENQNLLVRALGSRSYARIGSAGEVPFHGRLIATTRSELDGAVRDGRFRADLLKLIGRLRLSIAPLRQRRADIRALAQQFLGLEKQRAPFRNSKLTEDALGYLEALPLWGNAAELRATVAEAVRRGRWEAIGLPEAAPEAGPEGEAAPAVALDPLEHAEKTLIAAVVRQCGGNIGRAAQILNMTELEVARISRQVSATQVE